MWIWGVMAIGLENWPVDNQPQVANLPHNGAS